MWIEYLTAITIHVFIFTGINDQGLYRVVGVSSKVQKLLSLMIGKFSLIWLLCKCSSVLGDLLWSPIIESRAGVLLSLIVIQTFVLSSVCLYVPLSCPFGDTWLHYCRQAIRFQDSLSLSHTHSLTLLLILFRLSQKPNTHTDHHLMLCCYPVPYSVFFLSFSISLFAVVAWAGITLLWMLNAVSSRQAAWAPAATWTQPL